MASDRKSFASLPNEILHHIVGYLEPSLTLKLPRVSRRLWQVSMDDGLWKHLCYEASPFWRGLQVQRHRPNRPAEGDKEARETMSGLGQSDGGLGQPIPTKETEDYRRMIVRRWQSSQQMAKWNPAFEGEQVSWRDEYRQRRGPVSVNWLQIPRREDDWLTPTLEVWGVALYNPNRGSDGIGPLLAVSPLEDGTVCLWDVTGTRGTQGRIRARSRPDTLSPARRGPALNLGSGIYAECVSVNHQRHRAFFANHHDIVEVDLNRLDVVSQQRFEHQVVALSTADEDVPLTVGTWKIHLYDFRTRAGASREASEWLDLAISDEPERSPRLGASSRLAGWMPLSILHVPGQGSAQSASHGFYVGGRFASILYYDRRRFPVVAGSVYSGAHINSLASLPFSSHMMQEAMPASMADGGEAEQAALGQALIAGGCYKSKGSLELYYGLSTATEGARHRLYQKSAVRNRQTAASASILSVANHGTKIVFSDGDGNLKWMERDGLTACRRLELGPGGKAEPSSQFESAVALDNTACRILSTGTGQEAQRRHDDNILFWTGEKLGLVSFTPSRLFDSADFEARAGDLDEAEEQARYRYEAHTRRALELQADETRVWSHLGTGTGPA